MERLLQRRVVTVRLVLQFLQQFDREANDPRIVSKNGGGEEESIQHHSSQSFGLHSQLPNWQFFYQDNQLARELHHRMHPILPMHAKYLRRDDRR